MHKEIIFLGWCGWTYLVCTEFWPRPHPASFRWTAAMAADLGHEEKNINKKRCRVKNMKYRLLSTVMFGVLFFGMLSINLKCFYNSIHAKLALFCCLWKAIAVRIGCTKYILYTLKYILNKFLAHMLFFIFIFVCILFIAFCSMLCEICFCAVCLRPSQQAA